MTNEKLSEWVDGELVGADSISVLNAVRNSPGQRQHCECYWLIGDVLRGSVPLDAGFTGKVMAALEAEPTVLAPMARPSNGRGRFEWMPVAAGVAGVAVAAWMGLGLWSGDEQDTAALARSAMPVQTASATGGGATLWQMTAVI